MEARYRRTSNFFMPIPCWQFQLSAAGAG
jgi:hypothetical protein